MSQLPGMPQIPSPQPAEQQWWQRPENIMTGVVLAAMLMQDRNRNQSKSDAFGERALGALAFRGGLDTGLQQQAERNREFEQKKKTQDAAVANDREQIAVQREGHQVQKDRMEFDASQQAAQLAAQAGIQNTPRPNTPGEETLLKSQAGYYDRMPRAAGAGDENDPRRFHDPYEEEIFKSWYTGKEAEAAAQGKAYVLNPMEFLAHIQPYRNARTQVDAMRNQGLMGELVLENGQYKVRVMGVADPQAAPAGPGTPAPTPEAPQAPVVTLNPVDEIVKMRPSARKPEEMVSYGGRTQRPARAAYIERMDEPSLRALLKDKRLSKEEILLAKEALKKNAKSP